MAHSSPVAQGVLKAPRMSVAAEPGSVCGPVSRAGDFLLSDFATE
jgi:hypothetical protein